MRQSPDPRPARSVEQTPNVLRHYAMVLRRRWRWIALGLVMGLLAGIAATLVGERHPRHHRLLQGHQHADLQRRSRIDPGRQQREPESRTNLAQTAFLVRSADIVNGVASAVGVTISDVNEQVNGVARSDVGAIDVTAISTDPEQAVLLADTTARVLLDYVATPERAAVRHRARSDPGPARPAERAALRPREQARRRPCEHRPPGPTRSGRGGLRHDLRTAPGPHRPRRRQRRLHHPADRHARPDQRQGLQRPPAGQPGSPRRRHRRDPVLDHGHRPRDRPQHRHHRVGLRPDRHRPGHRPGARSPHRLPGRGLGRSPPPQRPGRGASPACPSSPRCRCFPSRNGRWDALIVLDLPRSAAAERYRTLRTSIQFAVRKHLATDGVPDWMRSPNRGGRRSILITSPNPGDGKTTTVANVAATLGDAGLRVLVIDCDHRKPSVGEYLDPALSFDGVTEPATTRLHNVWFVPPPVSDETPDVLPELITIITRWSDGLRHRAAGHAADADDERRHRPAARGRQRAPRRAGRPHTGRARPNGW